MGDQNQVQILDSPIRLKKGKSSDIDSQLAVRSILSQVSTDFKNPD